MCGIAGSLDFKSQKRSKRIKTMLQNMKHRGPDGTAYKILNNACFGLNRLSMTGIKDPVTIFKNDESNLLCTFNGEIYNHHSLRELLPKKGRELRTQNDGEIILHLYKIYGKNFITLLDGMFTIAITNGKKILLYSDFFGIKPLYYATLPDGTFLFSSELRPILNQMPKQTISESALASYFQYRFVAHPFTIFSDIHKLSPHQIIEITDVKITKNTYAPRIKPQKNITNWITNIHKYESNEVNIGYFLSGGLDSSILATLSTKTAHTFTIKYPYMNGLDEVSYAKQVAERNRHVHHICEMKQKHVKNYIKKAIISLEEPLYSTIAPSTYFLAQSAKQFVKGIISGDGADEMFIGYHYIRSALNTPSDKIAMYKKQIGWLDDVIASLVLTKRIKSINLISERLSPLNTIMEFERTYRLPSYHLFRLDKMTMANSIEARVPFLSNDILSVLLGHKTDDFYTDTPKEFLINVFKNLLPDDIAIRKKQPFPSPYIHWINTCIYKDIRNLFMNNKLCSIVNIDSKQATNLLKTKEKSYSEYTAIWGIYMLLKWAKYYKKYLKK